MISDSAILKKIERQPKRTAGFKQLVREMGIHGDARRELSERLKRLVSGKQLVQVDSDRYAIPQASSGKNLIVGRLSMHRDGFGFVIPDASALDERLKARLSGDIFIPPPAVGSAMHGDRVLVEITTIRPDGRAEGRIVRPLHRAHSTVVGIFHFGNRYNYVTPLDRKISQEIIIPKGLELPEKASDDGAAPGKEDKRKKTKKSVHRVLGEEAKRTRPDNLENVVVDVEITDWPTATQNPRGRVVEILGYEDDFGVDVEIMIRKHHLPHRFPPETVDQAESVPVVIASWELEGRRDFRGMDVVTIDGETARDFDDAVWVDPLPNGNFALHVHIADVSHYVRPGAPIDIEARLRGTSVYFPDRAVPMLPFELSTNICSLKPQVDRLVLSALLEFDHQGDLVHQDFTRGVIRSVERMTYTNVHLLLEGDPGLRERYAALAGRFERMPELGVIL